MLRGLYTATSAMRTNDKKLDVVTNNIANADTVGYKKDFVISESFPDVLIKKIHSNDFGKFETFKGIETKEEDGLYEVSTTAGFFRVEGMGGVSHQRRLKFTVNENGYLSTYNKDYRGNVYTDEGSLVLGNKGPILVGEGELEINDQGQVMVDGNMVDNLIMRTSPNVIGTMNAGVRVDKIQVNYEQGALQGTENPLDLGLQGSGFFKIQTPEGIAYTRDGSFQIDKDGEMVTLEGHKVMGMDGPIALDNAEISISEIGEIMVNGEFYDQIEIVDINNVKDLRKEAGNVYEIREGAEAKEQQFEGIVRQGFLEKSNVDSVKEVVRMMSLFRNYETSQRLIKSYDDTLAKSVNEIGKI